MAGRLVTHACSHCWEEGRKKGKSVHSCCSRLVRARVSAHAWRRAALPPVPGRGPVTVMQTTASACMRAAATTLAASVNQGEHVLASAKHVFHC